MHILLCAEYLIGDFPILANGACYPVNNNIRVFMKLAG